MFIAGITRWVAAADTFTMLEDKGMTIGKRMSTHAYIPDPILEQHLHVPLDNSLMMLLFLLIISGFIILRLLSMKTGGSLRAA